MHRVGHNTYFLCFAIFNTNSMSAECVLIKHDLVHETRDANLFKHFPESVSGVCFFLYILHDTLLCLKLHVEPTHSIVMYDCSHYSSHARYNTACFYLLS